MEHNQSGMSVDAEYGPYKFHSDYRGKAINRGYWDSGRPRAFYFSRISEGFTVTASNLSGIKERIKEALQ